MATTAKQDPVGKKARAKASDGRVYFSYAQIHAAITSVAPKVKEFRPDIIIAIGGGGFVPARMLRTIVKVPILAISLELYDDATCTARDQVVRKQWYDIASELGEKVPGGRVLIVDEVDDTRTTLEYAIKEVMKDGPAAVAVACVHNKKKPKKGEIPAGVEYMSGEDVDDHWNCYPWDAESYGRDIYEHERLARACAEGISAEAEKSAFELFDVASFFAGAAAMAAAAWFVSTARPRT